MNVVVITDGCSNNDCGRLEEDKEGTSWYTTHIPYRGNNVVFITDPVTKKDFKVNRLGRDTAALTATYLQVLKDRTGCNVVGFYLAQTNKSGSVHKHDLRYMFPNSDIHEIRAELRKNKVVICDTMGYDEYYFLPGGSALDISDEKLSVDRSMTKGKMVKAFSKHKKPKIHNSELHNK